MKDLKEQFEKFDLLPLSHSRINSYIEHKADFVAKYIYGNQMPSTPSMTRGNAVEMGLNHYLTGESEDRIIWKQEAVDFAINYFMDLKPFFTETVDEIEKELKVIKPMTELLIDKFDNGGLRTGSNFKRHFTGYQNQISTQILGLDLIGFTDFTFEFEDEIIVIDVKTSSQFKLNYGHVLQQAIYKKAIQEKSNKNVRVRLLMTTKSKCDFIDADFDDPKHLQYIECHLMSLGSLLAKCKYKEDISKIIIPDLAHWSWNKASKEKIAIRQNIWGF